MQCGVEYLFIKGFITSQRIEISALREKFVVVVGREDVTLSQLSHSFGLTGGRFLSQPWRPKEGKQKVMQTVRRNSFWSSNSLTTS
jgi:hypothetical protein